MRLSNNKDKQEHITNITQVPCLSRRPGCPGPHAPRPILRFPGRPALRHHSSPGDESTDTHAHRAAKAGQPDPRAVTTPQAPRRTDKIMPEADALALLARGQLAHFATTGADGMPYAVPNLFVFADGILFTHTTSADGHFRRNVEHDPRISASITEMGEVYPYGATACDTTLSYASVVVFGTTRIETDPTAKAVFFDRLMAKYADPGWARPAGFYPRLGDTTVYAITPTRITGKAGALPPMAERWPARNATRSPDAVPPGGWPTR